MTKQKQMEEIRAQVSAKKKFALEEKEKHLKLIQRQKDEEKNKILEEIRLNKLKQEASAEAHKELEEETAMRHAEEEKLKQKKIISQSQMESALEKPITETSDISAIQKDVSSTSLDLPSSLGQSMAQKKSATQKTNKKNKKKQKEAKSFELSQL